MPTKPRILAAAGALLALYWWMAAGVSPGRGVAADEIAHLTAGYSYWMHNDYRLQPENGNLPQRWAALPVVFSPARFPQLDQPVWEKSDVWRLGFQFFFTQGNDLGAMLGRGRAMIALFGVALGWLVFAWSRSLWGDAGGLISLTLFGFCPNLLAHGGLITSDMAASLGFLAAVGAVWRLYHRLTLLNMLLLGGAAGALALAKFSAPLLAPVALLLLLLRLLRPFPLPMGWFRPGREITGRGRLAGVLVAASASSVLVAVVIVWLAFGFRYAMVRPGETAVPLQSWEEVTSWKSPAIRAVEFAREHRLLPEAYLYGFSQVYRFSRYRRAYFNGEHRLTGWASFFPYLVAVKTPLAFFALAGLTLAASGRLRPGQPAAGPRETLHRLSPLLALGSVYALFAVATPLNIGHRHVLPLYPVAYIFAGAAGPVLWRAGRLGRIGVALILAWFCADSLAARPRYLAYFNPLDGGPDQAWRHVTDSSLDWGQELPALKQWLDTHRKPGEPLFLSYFGSDDPVFRGIEAMRVGDSNFDLRGRSVPARLTGGLYAISATQFHQVYTFAFGPWDETREHRYRDLLRLAQAGRVPEEFEDRRKFLTHLEDHQFARLCHFLRNRPPEALIGHAILVFRLDDDEVARALAGPLSP